MSCRLLSIEGAGRCVLEDNESKEIYLDTQSEIVLPSSDFTVPETVVCCALRYKGNRNTDKVAKVFFIFTIPPHVVLRK